MHPNRTKRPDARRPKVRDREHDALVKAAWEAGWWCEQRKGGSVLCLAPDGVGKVTVHGTANDPRSFKNVRSDFRRAGLDI